MSELLHKLETMIDNARHNESPEVPTLLGYLCRAQSAVDKGDNNKATCLINIALKN